MKNSLYTNWACLANIILSILVLFLVFGIYREKSKILILSTFPNVPTKNNCETYIQNPIFEDCELRVCIPKTEVHVDSKGIEDIIKFKIIPYIYTDSTGTVIGNRGWVSTNTLCSSTLGASIWYSLGYYGIEYRDIFDKCIPLFPEFKFKMSTKYIHNVKQIELFVKDKENLDLSKFWEMVQECKGIEGL